VACFKIDFKASAYKELETLPDNATRSRVIRRIESLAENPRPPGCEKLTDRGNHYRIRQGDYRIVHTIEDDRLVILIIKIRHRRDVYRH
jgi:mRNA interferase RelE/StbE